MRQRARPPARLPARLPDRPTDRLPARLPASLLAQKKYQKKTKRPIARQSEGQVGEAMTEPHASGHALRYTTLSARKRGQSKGRMFSSSRVRCRRLQLGRGPPSASRRFSRRSLTSDPTQLCNLSIEDACNGTSNVAPIRVESASDKDFKYAPPCSLGRLLKNLLPSTPFFPAHELIVLG